MLPNWTSDRILDLAPDESSKTTIEALATPHKWLNLGQGDRVIWGECKDRRGDPYRTQVVLQEPQFQCSCPSRKLPCKHGLGLLLLFSRQPDAFMEETPPEWVEKWLLDRHREGLQKAQMPTRRQLSNPDARAKRMRERQAKVEAGMKELELWLRDLMGQGLATLPSQPDEFWQAAAARMVDAQAPGIAQALRSMSRIPHSGVGWPQRLLGRLGRLHLLIEGFQRLEQLPPGTQADIRTQIGWTQNREELLQKSGMGDLWWVLGERIEEEVAGTANLKAQRIWLWGQNCKRYALILNFAYGNQAFDISLVPGTKIDAELVFYPTAYPLRAVLKTPQATPMPLETMVGYETIDAALAAYSHALGKNPWLVEFPMVLSACIPQHRGEIAIDVKGQALPLAPFFTQGWQLMAMSGGEAIALFGEWNGTFLLPLAALAEGRLVQF